ncbi:osmotically inducible protein OsmC [Nonlabens arenilitoris]|uniref:Osmotically inducible protein OsmC n=1 Tax=Nonlabens arenilitoris TaxID=1217969 RepID=A0A2S7UC71_9FLAO|nr:OsmC family protein [Nonlabens arenilitoris]PQJ32210.1 osmotically inducible protein OsmC [Nonlabens arenilitoris]
MKKDFTFEVATLWKKGQFENPKTHISQIAGKKDMIISAAREFKGDECHYNPEDFLLNALSSCHMMSYFYVCQQYGIEILEYSDKVTGTLLLNDNASGAFQKIVLQPKVIILDVDQVTLATSLHNQAHQLCFIANSVKFEVEIKPIIETR